jgi:hypothetical protein
MNLQDDIWSLFNQAKKGSETVIWSHSSIPENERPSLPYITIDIQNVRHIGTSQTENTGLTSGSGGDERLKINQKRHYEITISCQYLISSEFDSISAEEYQFSLDSNTSYEYALSLDSDIKIARFGNITPISKLIQGAFEGRSVFDVFLDVEVEREELIQFIDTVSVQNAIITNGIEENDVSFDSDISDP